MADENKGWLRVAWLVLPFTVVIPWVLHHCQHDPPVGVYIGIVGGLAAAVTFRKEPGPREKALWILGITILIVAEITNLYHEARMQEERFQKITSDLEAAIGGLNTTIVENQKHFDATMRRSDEIMTGVAKVFSIQTGGDSYLWYDLTILSIGSDALEGYKNSLIVQGFPRVVGHYALPSAHVEVTGPMGWVIGGPTSTPSIEYQDLKPNELVRSRQGFSIKSALNPAKQVFHVLINTSNGSYEQVILVEKIGEQWEFGTRIYKAPRGKPLRVVGSRGLPKVLLKPNANW
jgi:hypothetical protein